MDPKSRNYDNQLRTIDSYNRINDNQVNSFI